MHVLLATFGTDGDVFPYLGLGARLRDRGHRVTLAGSGDYEELAAAHGLGFHALVSRAEAMEVFGHPDLWHPLKAGPLLARWGAKYIGRNYEDLAGLVVGGADIIAASPGVLGARLVQERLGVPLASVVLQPGSIPSSIAPPIMPAGLTLPRWAPRPLASLYWRGLDAVAELLIGSELVRVRRSLRLPRLRRLFRWWLSPQLTVGFFPPWYGPPQADWPPSIRLAGFPLHDGRPRGGLPREVLEHCTSGPPPIAFTPGTGMRHGAAFFREAAEACRRLGARGLFLTRHAAQLPSPLPPGILHVPYAPFSELFPRCAAVVHHGGVGTTARALAAGTPQLIAYFGFDQKDNARRVERLGAGEGLSGRRRTAAHLAAALERVVRPDVSGRCREVAARFGEDDALMTAAAWIEDLADRSGVSAAAPRDDLHVLPPGLPVPLDDGACRHLRGARLPPVPLTSTSGERVRADELGAGWLVLYCFPRIGRPDREPPGGYAVWNAIPGARGCAPQSCAYRDRHEELRRLGARVCGISAQPAADLREARERLRLPFELLSDAGLELGAALRLPTFEHAGERLLKRLTLIARGGEIVECLYPVFPSDADAPRVLELLRERAGAARGAER